MLLFIYCGPNFISYLLWYFGSQCYYLFTVVLILLVIYCGLLGPDVTIYLLSSLVVLMLLFIFFGDPNVIIIYCGLLWSLYFFGAYMCR